VADVLHPPRRHFSTTDGEVGCFDRGSCRFALCIVQHRSAGGAVDVRAKALATSGRCSLLDRAGMVEARYRDMVEARVRTRRLFGLQMGSFDQEQLGLLHKFVD
jgi:hypothetical protein